MNKSSVSKVDYTLLVGEVKLEINLRMAEKELQKAPKTRPRGGTPAQRKYNTFKSYLWNFCGHNKPEVIT